MMASSKKRMQVWLLPQLLLVALKIQVGQANNATTTLTTTTMTTTSTNTTLTTITTIKPTTVTTTIYNAPYGFCQDQVPAGLVGTGFNAKSVLTHAQCIAGGHKWCALDTTIKEWDHDGDAATPAIEWYYYSGCCNGKQGATLKVDPVTHLPTCRQGMSSAVCQRSQWQLKIYNDLIQQSDTYNFQIIPATRENMDPGKYNGFTMVPVGLEEGGCICKPDSKHCFKTTEDGAKCIWCKDIGDVGCDSSAVKVRFGLQFFKLHTVDLKSSLMSFQGWIRADWYDRRLDYDYQCYGGLASFEVQAQAGNLENSVIWVPDFELYNNEVPLWSEQFPSRLAIIYSCWNGNPSRGGCGYVWWSRPSVVKAMCKYGGLIMFPMEVLSCELEVAAWAVTGNHQDFFVMSGTSGISWTGGTDEFSMAGIAGGSAFQDYRIKHITARRDITIYNCCPDPFPTLIYMIEFTRANYFYQIKLFLPSIMITLVSFWTFWMDPAIGERLGFGITVMLAVITNDIVATEMMPITDASLLMDYVSLICYLFSMCGLVESAVVLNLYYRCDHDWQQAMMPLGAYKVYREMIRMCQRCRRGGQGEDVVQPIEIPADKKGLFRLQLYKEIFFSLDKNHSGELELPEMEAFGAAVMGAKLGDIPIGVALDRFDANGNGRLSFDEFITFCENNIQEKNDVSMLARLLRGYVRAIDREEIAISEMWKGRAYTVDTISRFAVPLAFFISLIAVFSKDEADLQSRVGPSKRVDQWSLKLCGFLFPVCVTAVYWLYTVCRSWSNRRGKSKSGSLDPAIAHPEIASIPSGKSEGENGAAMEERPSTAKEEAAKIGLPILEPATPRLMGQLQADAVQEQTESAQGGR